MNKFHFRGIKSLFYSCVFCLFLMCGSQLLADEPSPVSAPAQAVVSTQAVINNGDNAWAGSGSMPAAP
jgi:hypothetical protein